MSPKSHSPKSHSPKSDIAKSDSPAIELRSCAVQVSPLDNTAVVRRDLRESTVVRMPDGRDLRITGLVTAGNRFATADVPAGELVRQYGQPIGTSRGIAAGDPVTPDNMSNEVPVVRDLPDHLATPAPDYLPESERATFAGYRRSDGRIGTRNWILVVPTSMCSSHEAQQIAMLAEFQHGRDAQHPNVDGVVAIPHDKGCGCPDGSNVDLVLRMLAHYADHPNVGAVLFVDLGCEKTSQRFMEQHLGAAVAESFDKPTAWIGVQQCGGTQATIEKGLAEVERMLPLADRAQREDVPISELRLGVECGSSDGFSGLSANPALGHASDQLVRSGGTVILSEVPEWCGAEHLLAQRARDADVGRAIYRMVDWFKELARKGGATLEGNPSPGNVASGLLNITVKSLGAIAKGGTTRVEGVTEFGVPPTGRGLWLMDGPGYDPASVPGLVAAGANVVVFTTGNGSTLGNAIVPVLKLASNNRVFERLSRDIDLSAGGVIDGSESIEDVGSRVFAHLREVASGRARAFAEENRHREFLIWLPEPMTL